MGEVSGQRVTAFRDEAEWAADYHDRQLVEIDTNYKATRRLVGGQVVDQLVTISGENHVVDLDWNITGGVRDARDREHGRACAQLKGAGLLEVNVLHAFSVGGPTEACTVIILPPAPVVVVTVRRGPDGRLLIGAQTDSNAAESMLAYLKHGQLAAATVLVDGVLEGAESLSHGRREDALDAVGGGGPRPVQRGRRGGGRTVIGRPGAS